MFRELLRFGLLLFVGVYRMIGTPHFGGQCRFEPSCSEYALNALQHHSPIPATLLILRRILKCRPGSQWGYDPVPPAKIKLFKDA